MAEYKYFYQDGYSAQEEKNKLKLNEEWAGKSLEEVKEGIINASLNEDQYEAFSLEFWKDETLVWACLKAEHNIELIFKHVRKFLWRDKEFVLSTMNERWFYPLTNIKFKEQDFNYFNYIHESLKDDKDIISAWDNLNNLKSS